MLCTIGSAVDSNQDKMDASIENRRANELFLQLLGGEIKDSDSSEDEEQGEKEEEEEWEDVEEVEEEEEEKKEQGEKDEQREESSEIDSHPDVVEDLSLDHNVKTTHEPNRYTTKETDGNRTQSKFGGQHVPHSTDSFKAAPGEKPPGEKPQEKSAPSSLTNCNSDEQNASQSCPSPCAADGHCAPQVPPSTNNNLELSNKVASNTTSKSTHPDSDSSSIDATRGKGLLDLLTSSIQDRFPRTPTMETHEELTSRTASTERSPSAFMETFVRSKQAG